MFGKLTRSFAPVKKWLSGARHDAIKGSQWLGKGIRDTRGVWNSGKEMTRSIASGLDKSLGTHGAFRMIADEGIRTVGGSAPGKALAAVVDEADFQNKRLQTGLNSKAVSHILSK
jgi:hypothetical protein